MWNIINQWIFCQILECQAPLNKRQVSPYCRPGDGSVGNEQRQGITPRTCNGKKPNSTARPSAQVTKKTASQRFSTIAGVKTCLTFFLKMGPHTYTGLRASVGSNVWSLACILRELNYYWNVKWTTKRSLHDWDHIIRFISIACYMQ